MGGRPSVPRLKRCRRRMTTSPDRVGRHAWMLGGVAEGQEVPLLRLECEKELSRQFEAICGSMISQVAAPSVVLTNAISSSFLATAHPVVGFTKL